jgi:hypothetical protein
MVGGQPIAQARRQQHRLLAIARQKVLRHPGIVLTPADRPRYATASMEEGAEHDGRNGCGGFRGAALPYREFGRASCARASRVADGARDAAQLAGTK